MCARHEFQYEAEEIRGCGLRLGEAFEEHLVRVQLPSFGEGQPAEVSGVLLSDALDAPIHMLPIQVAEIVPPHAEEGRDLRRMGAAALRRDPKVIREQRHADVGSDSRGTAPPNKTRSLRRGLRGEPHWLR